MIIKHDTTKQELLDSLDNLIAERHSKLECLKKERAGSNATLLKLMSEIVQFRGLQLWIDDHTCDNAESEDSPEELHKLLRSLLHTGETIVEAMFGVKDGSDDDCDDEEDADDESEEKEESDDEEVSDKDSDDDDEDDDYDYYRITKLRLEAAHLQASLDLQEHTGEKDINTSEARMGVEPGTLAAEAVLPKLEEVAATKRRIVSKLRALMDDDPIVRDSQTMQEHISEEIHNLLVDIKLCYMLALYTLEYIREYHSN